jgi:hypothetical protein
MNLDIFDPEDQRLLSNSDMVDPLCGWARWGCWYIDLPLLEEEVAAGKQGALNEAIRLIAQHQVAPPPWLAAAMLEKFKVKPPRKNALSVEKAHEVTLMLERKKAELARANRNASIKIIGQLHALGPGMNRTKLNKYLKLWRDYEAKLNKIADELP